MNLATYIITGALVVGLGAHLATRNAYPRELGALQRLVVVVSAAFGGAVGTLLWTYYPEAPF